MIEELIKKVAKMSRNSAEAKKLWDVEQDAKYGKCPAYSIEDAAGNHAFDDYPDVFGITENEGHHIRAYFQSTGCRYNDERRDLVNGWIEEAK